jgi:hypothetical protein
LVVLVPQLANSVCDGWPKQETFSCLSDEELHCLLESDSEQSLSESDFDTENELYDRALIDAVGNEGSDEDESEGPRHSSGS